MLGVESHYFPFNTPRPDQMEVIADVITAIHQGKHYILIDAGTGFGKSSVARTICDMYCKEAGKNSFILTATKQLQKQYELECFNNKNHVNYQVGVGRANFKCKNLHETVQCTDGYCKIKSQKDQPCIYGITDNDPCTHGGCYYWESKANCIESDVALLNYNVLMSDNQYVNHYPDRDIMICDEAHNIEAKIMSEVGILLPQSTIFRDIGYKFDLNHINDSELDYWLNELQCIVDRYACALENNAMNMKVKDIEHFQKYSKNLLNKITIIEENPDNWVVNVDKQYNKNNGEEYINHIAFKPVFIKEYANKLLFDSANVKIFMSGSFVDYKKFCEDLGINLDDVYYRKAKNSFDHIHRNSISLKYANHKLVQNNEYDMLPKFVDYLDNVLNENPKVKGLVHCNSKKYANYVMKHLGSRMNGYRLITYDSSIMEGKGSKDYQIKKFKGSDKPLVMISYSLHEGIDLKYDLCRFQVFFKAPYPYYGDNQIQARIKYDKEHKNVYNSWYNRKTAERIIQMWGRGMRAEDDYCQNYIFDSNVKSYYIMKLLPIEMKRAMHNPINNINDTIGVKAK